MQITTERLAGFTILHLRGEFDTFESLRLVDPDIHFGGYLRLSNYSFIVCF